MSVPDVPAGGRAFASGLSLTVGLQVSATYNLAVEGVEGNRPAIPGTTAMATLSLVAVAVGHPHRWSKGLAHGRCERGEGGQRARDWFAKVEEQGQRVPELLDGRGEEGIDPRRLLAVKHDFAEIVCPCLAQDELELPVVEAARGADPDGEGFVRQRDWVVVFGGGEVGLIRVPVVLIILAVVLCCCRSCLLSWPILLLVCCHQRPLEAGDLPAEPRRGRGRRTRDRSGPRWCRRVRRWDQLDELSDEVIDRGGGAAAALAAAGGSRSLEAEARGHSFSRTSRTSCALLWILEVSNLRKLEFAWVCDSGGLGNGRKEVEVEVERERDCVRVSMLENETERVDWGRSIDRQCDGGQVRAK